MSAFLVNDKHINALLTYAKRPQYQAPSYYYHNGNRRTFYDNLDLIGQILINENYKSLQARYGEPQGDNSEFEPHEYKFEGYPYSMLSPVRVIKACDCYNYQACETGEAYYKSEAHSIIEAIRERAIHSLPGYDEADWEIS